MGSTRGSAPASGAEPIHDRIRRALLTGTALIIPLVLTIVVLQFALDLVSQAVSPFVAGIELLFDTREFSELALEALTVATLVGLILVIGALAEYRADSGHLSESFDALMARIPGLGSVYTGIRRLSEVLLEQDTQSFHEVKLVEFPRDGSYMVGFLTAEPPEAIRDVAETPEMQTLFVPLAPNPVMGGFLVHLPEDRIHEVDLSIEEGVQSILTTGAAIDPRVEHTERDPLPIGDGELLDGHVLSGDLLGDHSIVPTDDE